MRPGGFMRRARGGVELRGPALGLFMCVVKGEEECKGGLETVRLAPCPRLFSFFSLGFSMLVGARARSRDSSAEINAPRASSEQRTKFGDAQPGARSGGERRKLRDPSLMHQRTRRERMEHFLEFGAALKLRIPSDKFLLPMMPHLRIAVLPARSQIDETSHEPG